MRKKKRITQISFIMLCMMLLSLLGGGTSVAEEPDPEQGPIATVTIEAGMISWEPRAESGELNLTISGPGDFYLQQGYESGARPTFTPEDSAGNPLPDGIYKYELQLMPVLGETLGGYDESQRGIVPLKGAGKVPVQSGSFSILNGGFVTQDMVEIAADAKFAKLLSPDHVINDDVIIDGSLCVGFDCVNGESFGFDTQILKENNLRIYFNDTSSIGAYPTNNWRITINDSTNGGASYFSIDDVDDGTSPFRIEAGAPSHSLYVDDDGDVGLGTSTPVVELHIKEGDSPTIRLEQDGSSGWAPQTWDVAGNETNFFVRDVTNGSKLSFRIQPGAPTNSLTIRDSGNVGIGTWSPQGLFHVEDTDVDFIVSDDGDVGIGTTGPGYKLDVQDAANGNMAYFKGVSPARLLVDVAGTNAGFGLLVGGALKWSIAAYQAGVGNIDCVLWNDQTSTSSLFIDGDTDNVGIGTTSPGYKLDVAGQAHATSFPTSSDARFKTNVTQLTDVLEKLEKVRGVFFDWNEAYESLGRSTGHREIGVIAQEVEAVFPELVTTWGDEDYRAVEYGRLTGVLVEAIKELRAEKDAEIAVLKQQNGELEKRVAALEALVTSLAQGQTE